jgi:hypothetical protein
MRLVISGRRRVPAALLGRRSLAHPPSQHPGSVSGYLVQMVRGDIRLSDRHLLRSTLCARRRGAGGDAGHAAQGRRAAPAPGGEGARAWNRRQEPGLRLWPRPGRRLLQGRGFGRMRENDSPPTSVRQSGARSQRRSRNYNGCDGRTSRSTENSEGRRVPSPQHEIPIPRGDSAEP